MSADLSELYQEVILDHSRRPRNFGELPDASARAHGDNPSCGDEIHVALKLTDDSIAEVKFTGQGCAISQASASMMTTKLKGKTRAQSLELLRAFEALVTRENVEPDRSLGDLRLMQGVRKFPQRVKCAMLAWRAAEQALSEDATAAPVSTERNVLDSPGDHAPGFVEPA